MADASCGDLPFASSVITEAHAIAGTQPLARKPIAAMRPASILIANSRMSPQAGFSIRTWASASGSSPELRGCSKWSRSWGEYMAARSTSLAYRMRLLSACSGSSYNRTALNVTDHTPRRIVSLQPSATVTLRDLGLLNRLVACTRYCADVCPEVADGSRVIV